MILFQMKKKGLSLKQRGKIKTALSMEHLAVMIPKIKYFY